MDSAIAIAAVEKLAPVIIAALAPEVQSLLKSIPAGLVKVAPPDGLDVEAAVAANLAKAMPAVTAEEFATIKTMIGNAVAEWATSHPGEDVTSDLAWEDIAGLTNGGIAKQGLDFTKIPLSTYRQMLASGIEMFRAGVGVKAITVATVVATTGQ